MSVFPQLVRELGFMRRRATFTADPGPLWILTESKRPERTILDVTSSDSRSTFAATFETVFPDRFERRKTFIYRHNQISLRP